jgi:hypothetical protein
MMDDKFYEELSNLINGAFDETFGRKEIKPKVRKPIMQTQPEPAPLEEQPQDSLYESIEDYTSKTGKRFRMTKDQKSRRLSRTQAFNETHGGTK